MPGQLASIGNFFAQEAPKVGGFLKSNMGTIIPGALTGFGFLNNLFNQQRYNRQQDLAYNLAKNPQAAARYTQGFERPLAAGLTQGVENEVQAALGERGLTLSPAIAAQAYSQALAPYIQDQQRLAAQEAMGYLGAGTSFPQAQMSDVSGPLAELMKRFQKPAGSTDPSQDPFSGQPYIPTDVTGIVDPTGATAPQWFPGNTAGFPSPDWSTILGSVSPSVPSFQLPAMSGGIGSDMTTWSMPSYSMPGGG